MTYKSATELIDALIAFPSRGPGGGVSREEQEVLRVLRTKLNEEEWTALPKLLAERRAGRLRPIESERLLREAEELMRQQRELEIRLQKEERERARQQEALERLRQEKERKRVQALRESTLHRVRKCLLEDFLRADDYFAESWADVITHQEFLAEKTVFVRQWFVDNLPETGSSRQFPDDEQLAAIAAVSGHIQVVTRAGSGKTATLVNRTFFLIKHCRVPPSAILLLAFNKEAAAQIRSRLAAMLGIAANAEDSDGRLPHVMTFHALAYAIVHPEETLLYDDSDTESKQLSRAFQQVIDDHLRDAEYQALVRELMLMRWRSDWERIEEGGHTKDKGEFLRYRRSFVRQSIDGTYVKSFGEKTIANFLFENSANYRYEQNHWWGGANYRPDFTIPKTSKSGVVIEYFGLQGDSDYDEMAQRKRAYWSTRPEWQFLEYIPSDLTSRGVEAFQDRLGRDLRDRGVKLVRLSEDEIWHRTRERAIDNFTNASRNFVGRCRQQSLSPRELRNLISSHQASSAVESKFLDLVSVLYSAYIDRLASAGEEDFSGLIQRAAQSVNEGTTRFSRRSRVGNLQALRYVCIDEFQDFSDLFFRLLTALRRVNPSVELFCVGDDWQAINGFAGSDLKYFNNFEQHLGAATKLYISTNYRSAPEIVALGNSLMAGRGKPAASAQKTPGKILVADLSKFAPEVIERERFGSDVISPAVSRLMSHAISQACEVALLSRRNGLPWNLNVPGDRNKRAIGMQDWLNYLKSSISEEQRVLVSTSTVHRYKGLERTMVIILDAVDRSYPLIHPDWVFCRVLGDTVEKIVDAERRLFYVAISRAIDTLVIVTDSQERSPFLEDIERKHRLTLVDWADFPAHRQTTSRLLVKVGNQPDRGAFGTFAIKDLLKAAGYRWSSVGWQCWAKSWSAEEFSFDMVRQEVWAREAKGVEVRITDQFDNLVASYLGNDGEWICVVDHLLGKGQGSPQ